MNIIDINGNERECIDVKPDKLWPGYMKVKYVSEVNAHKVREEWYPKQDFIKNNPSLSEYVKDVKDLWKEDLGSVSASTEKTLTDKTKKWQLNEFAGYPLWISRGEGEGQTRTILSNDSTTLTIDTIWDVLPNKFSQYVISHNVHDPQIMGNTLPIDNKVVKPKRKRVNI